MVDVVVEFEYIANEDDELTIKIGEIINDVNKMEGGWWEGSLNGKRGMFPDNFVKELKKDKPSEPVPVPNNKKTGSNVANLAMNLGQGGIKIGLPPPAQPKADKSSAVAKKVYAKVTFQYIPQHEDELGLEVGEKIEVTKQDEEGWWEGLKGSKTGVFPSNFVELITEEHLSSDEVEKNEKEKDAEHQIKGKKVKGVGLGDIFGGGPIRLRSRDETESKPEVKSDNKVKKAATPPPAAKEPPALPPKETKEPKPADLDVSHNEVGSIRNKDVLFFNMTGDSMMVYDVDSYASPDRSDLYITVENYSEHENSNLVEVDAKSCSDCSQYTTPESEMGEYCDNEESYLSDESTETATANFSKVWNEDELPLETSTLSQARQTPPPKESFLRRRKSRSSAKDSPAPLCHSTPGQFNESSNPLVYEADRILSEEKIILEDNKSQSPLLQQECGDNSATRKIQMRLAVANELDSGKIIDSLKLTKTRLLLPGDTEVPPFMHQVSHVNMVLEDDVEEDASREQAQVMDDLYDWDKIDDSKSASHPRKLRFVQKNLHAYRNKSSTLPAKFADYEVKPLHAKTAAFSSSSLERSFSFKPVSHHLSFLSPKHILKKMSFKNVRHTKSKHNSPLNIDAPESYLEFLCKHDRVPPVFARVMARYHIYPEGKMDYGYWWHFKSHLPTTATPKKENIESTEIFTPAVVHEEMPEVPSVPKPKRKLLPKRAKSAVKDSIKQPFFNLRRSFSTAHTKHVQDQGAPAEKKADGQVENEKSTLSGDARTGQEEASKKPKRRNSLLQMFSFLRRTKSKSSKSSIDTSSSAANQNSLDDPNYCSGTDELSMRHFHEDSDVNSNFVSSDHDAIVEMPTKEQNSITDISLQSFAMTMPEDTPFDILESEFNEFIARLNDEKNSYLGVEQPSYSQYSSQRCSLAGTKEDMGSSDDMQQPPYVAKIIPKDGSIVSRNRDVKQAWYQDIPQTDKAVNTGRFPRESNTNQSANPSNRSPRGLMSEVLDAFEMFINNVAKDSITEEDGDYQEPLCDAYLKAASLSKDHENYANYRELHGQHLEDPNENYANYRELHGQHLEDPNDEYKQAIRNKASQMKSAEYKQGLNGNREKDAGCEDDDRYDDYRRAIKNQQNLFIRKRYDSALDRVHQSEQLGQLKDGDRSDDYRRLIINRLASSGYENENFSADRDRQNKHEQYDIWTNTNMSIPPSQEICNSSGDQEQTSGQVQYQEDKRFDYQQEVAHNNCASLLPGDSSYSTVYDQRDIEAAYDNVSPSYQALTDDTSASSKEASYIFSNPPTAFHRIYKSHSQNCTPEPKTSIRQLVASSNSASMDSFYDKAYDDEDMPLLYSQSLPLDASGHRWARCVNPNSCPTEHNADDLQIQDVSQCSVEARNLPRRSPGDSFNYSKNDNCALQISVSGSPCIGEQDGNQSMVLEEISFNILDDLNQLLPGLTPSQGVDILPEKVPDYDVLPEKFPSYDVLPERIQGYGEVRDARPTYDEVDYKMEDPLQSSHGTKRPYINQRGDSTLDGGTFPCGGDGYLSNESSPDIGRLLTNTTQNAQEYYYTLGGISPRQSPLVQVQSSESRTNKQGTYV